MWKSRLIYALTLAGVLVFHTYYTGWFSWYLLMLALVLPWFSLVCSLPSMLRLRLSANFPESCCIKTPSSVRIGSENAQRLTPPYRFDVLTEFFFQAPGPRRSSFRRSTRARTGAACKKEASAIIWAFFAFR